MADWGKIAKFAGLLGSSGDGEVVNAARMIDRALKNQGLTWGDVVNRLAAGGTYNPTGAARTSAEAAQGWRREAEAKARARAENDAAWEERMRQEEEKARQGQSRARREGRSW